MTRLFNLAAGMGLPSARYARFGQAHTGDLQKRRYTTAGSRWLAYNDGVNSANTATVRRLVAGRIYIFRVAARNLAGQSAFSSPSAAVRA
jgi:hypothetical protein